MSRTELLFRIVLPVGLFLLQQYLAPLPPQPNGFCKPKFKALEAVYRYVKVRQQEAERVSQYLALFSSYVMHINMLYTK